MLALLAITLAVVSSLETSSRTVSFCDRLKRPNDVRLVGDAFSVQACVFACVVPPIEILMHS